MGLERSVGAVEVEVEWVAYGCYDVCRFLVRLPRRLCAALVCDVGLYPLELDLDKWLAHFLLNVMKPQRWRTRTSIRTSV